VRRYTKLKMEITSKPAALDAIDRCRAVQVEPIEPLLKAPGTQRLKLQYDEPLSKFASRLNLRRYTAPS